MLLNVVHKFCFANAVFLSLYIFTVIGVVFLRCWLSCLQQLAMQIYNFFYKYFFIVFKSLTFIAFKNQLLM